jgi:hypothetical protein
MRAYSSRALWGVSAFFDPCDALPSLAVLERFSARVRAQGLPLLIVELAFGAAPFRIPASMADRVVRWRSDTVLWHKERLLNLGFSDLPSECRYVAWLDADVIFENDDWVSQTVARLQTYRVVQPFETACWTDASGLPPPRGLPPGVGEGHELPSLASTLESAVDRRRVLGRYLLHGHTGFAWAAHREVIERYGLYDRAILGGGDVINAHALAGDDDFLRGLNLYCRELSPRERESIGSWGRAIAAETGGRIASIPGRAVHLYHGPTSSRGYLERLKILRESDFDPECDIVTDAEGCWRWNSDKPILQQRVRDYFVARAHQPSSVQPADAVGVRA